MRVWWDARSASERLWLSVGALVVAASAWYLLLVEPLNEARRLALTRVNAAELHQELVELSDEAVQLGLHGSAYAAFDAGSSILFGRQQHRRERAHTEFHQTHQPARGRRGDAVSRRRAVHPSGRVAGEPR